MQTVVMLPPCVPAKWEDSAGEDVDAEAEPESTLPQDAVPSPGEHESA